MCFSEQVDSWSVEKVCVPYINILYIRICWKNVWVSYSDHHGGRHKVCNPCTDLHDFVGFEPSVTVQFSFVH
jgi:hypothetical protein